MRELNGAELVGFIKERQAHQVRGLRQAWRVTPKLLILRDNDGPVISKYVGLKKQYGEDILVEVEEKTLQDQVLQEEIARANQDSAIHGIIVQLPLQGSSLHDIDKILGQITPEKDVDGLNPFAGPGLAKGFTPATAEAINWLLTGYNIELAGKQIAVVGQGRLVGAPLTRLWHEYGYKVRGFDIGDARGPTDELPKYDVVVSATGQPGLLKPDIIKIGAVVVDAGTASEGGVIKGDASDELRARRDITITPKVGGVGPLTVAVLFDHVIQAASAKLKD